MGFQQNTFDSENCETEIIFITATVTKFLHLQLKLYTLQTRPKSLEITKQKLVHRDVPDPSNSTGILATIVVIRNRESIIVAATHTRYCECVISKESTVEPPKPLLSGLMK